MRTRTSGSADGSLTELAALEAARSREASAAGPRRRGGRPSWAGTPACRPAARPTTCRPCCSATTGASPPPRSLGHEPAELAGLAARPPAAGRGPPARLRHRRRAARCPTAASVIRLVTDDMPYLVDSVTAEVVRQGVDARARRAPGRRRPPRPARDGSRPSATAPTPAAAGPTRSPSPGWPSSSTARWTTRPPPTWSPACAPCSTTSGRVDEDADRLRARRARAGRPARRSRPPAPGADGRPGRRPGRGGGAAALAGRRQLRLPRRPRRRPGAEPREAAAAGRRTAPGSACCAATPT